jgi:branched-chain amino acid transport system substrate-binding protein
VWEAIIERGDVALQRGNDDERVHPMVSRFRLDRRQVLKGMGGTALAAALPGALVQRAYADDDVISIAVACPMTGNDAAEGLNAQRGADMALAEINGSGGIGGKKVAYDIFDDEGTPQQAAAVAQRILDANKYAAVIGHVDSSCTLAAMPIYSDANMPVLCSSSSNPAVTESGWTDIIRMTIRDDYGAQELSAFAVNNLGKKDLGLFFVNNDYGRGLRDEMVKAINVLPGAKEAAEAGFTPDVDKDFTSVITDFKAKGVDVYMLNCSYTEGGLFLGQAKGLGITGIPTVGPDSLLYDKFLELSQGAAEGAYILAAYDPYSDAPLTKTFMEGYAKAYTGVPSQVAVFTHDLFYALKAAFAAGATSDTLISTIKGLTLVAAGGKYSWDQKGDVKGRTFAVIQVKDGKFASTGKSVDETGLSVLRS